jgi:hypothetical protein
MIARIREVATEPVTITQEVTDKSTVAADQIERRSENASKERGDISASLAKLEELASGIGAMQEAVDQLSLLQRLAAD